jgi:hypothetical protein
MPMNPLLIGGRVAALFADQRLKRRKVNAFCQTQ